MKNLSKELLGLAGEYAVASELCRHGLYSQLTLGSHKQTDILIETEYKMIRISVKTKQGTEWPAVSGIYREDDFLVLVDYKGKVLTHRPDFYILGFNDWRDILTVEREKHPLAVVTEKYQIVYPDGWRGLNLQPKHVQQYKEQWNKIQKEYKEEV